MNLSNSILFLLLSFFLLLSSCSSDDEEIPQADDLTGDFHVTLEVTPYGVDGLNLQLLDVISDLGDGISGINGISWEDIEPTAPQNGVHSYQLGAEMTALRNALQSTDRGLQLNFRLSSEWAIERDPGNQVTNPGTGQQEDGILRVKPAYKEDLAAVIRHMLSNMEIDALQVGSEAENEWLDGAAYVDALRIIYEAAKEVQPDIVIMAFGFNPANYFTQPQNFDEDLIESKLTFVRTVMQLGAPYYDAFSFHASREYEAIAPTVDWLTAQMQSNGYQKPIWVDDLYSAPWLSANATDPGEVNLFNGLLNEEATAIATFDSLQAGYMIKKLTASFAAGIQKVFVSTDVNWDFYYIPNWRFAGLINSQGQLKPSYHNLQLLIAQTNDFEEVRQIAGHLYEYTFTGRPSVYVYWVEAGDPTVDLSALGASSYRVHEFAFRLGEVPASVEVSDLAGYSFRGNPVLIEPLD